MNKMKKRKGRPRTEAEPRSRLLSVPVTPATYERLKRLAKTKGCTLAEYIRLVIKASDDGGGDDGENDQNDMIEDRNGIIMSTRGKSPSDPGTRRKTRAAA